MTSQTWSHSFTHSSVHSTSRHWGSNLGWAVEESLRGLMKYPVFHLFWKVKCMKIKPTNKVYLAFPFVIQMYFFKFYG